MNKGLLTRWRDDSITGLAVILPAVTSVAAGKWARNHFGRGMIERLKAAMMHVRFLNKAFHHSPCPPSSGLRIAGCVP